MATLQKIRDKGGLLVVVIGLALAASLFWETYSLLGLLFRQSAIRRSS